jgi:uncharacterized protein DUF1566
MSKHLLKLNVALMVVLMAAGVGAWVPFASAGAKEVKPKAPVPETGQTLSYAEGDDGDVRAGVAWPIPRFTDGGNGTVRDNLTGLIWLQDGMCGGNNHPWLDALTFANTLASGICGLTDGSVEGDWRLPNIQELQSLVDFSQENPAFPAGHPFTIVLSGVTRLWSSTTRQASNYAWTLDVRDGTTVIRQKTFEPESAWAVRGGN